MIRLLRPLRIAVALGTIALLGAAGYQVISLYLAGAANLTEAGALLSPVFTRENVARRLTALLPFSLAYALLCAWTLLLQAFAREEPPRAASCDDMRLRRLQRTVVSPPAQAFREQALRRRAVTGTGIIMLAVSSPAIAYLLDGRHFASWELEAVMGDMLQHVLPPLALALAFACIASLYCGRSVRRELQMLKGLPSARPEPAPSAGSRALPVIRAALMIAAAVMIIDGVSNGGVRDVLIKAINICTECIGLG